jgi:hypothetical protein
VDSGFRKRSCSNNAAPDSPEESAPAYFFALHNKLPAFVDRCSDRHQPAVPAYAAINFFPLIQNSYFCASDLARRL